MQVNFQQKFLLFASASLATVITSFNNFCLANTMEVKPSPEKGLNHEKQEVIKNNEFEFTALTPDEPIVLPEEGKSVSINIGFRIANKSSHAKRFLLYQIRPIFLDEKQQVISPPLACARPRPFLTALPPRLLGPGENLVVLDQSSWLSRRQGELYITYMTNDVEECEFRGFKAGRYSVLINYDTLSSNVRLSAKDRENLWTGNIRSNPGSLILVEKP
ncbi:MAG: hypothetical protein HC860_22450 [Alkalinema sp. RU_4_3]|nr:hypothetical protein [Alkalinema sp. RU_4_3]